MSSHTSSPQLQDGLNLLAESQIDGAIRDVRRISDSTSTDLSWEQRILIGRAAIGTFEATGFMRLPNHRDDRIFVVNSLQRLAYHEADGNSVADIAQWCMEQWLSLLQRSSEDLDALRGVGQAWLARSQIALARIHRVEGSSSSGSSGRPHSMSERMSYSSAEEARDAERAIMEADARAHTADYVEARGMLIPAVDYFVRAVELADRDGGTTGELLSEAAEINMSLGNVEYSQNQEQYFTRAIRYLRRASQIQEFRLSPYLQSYLDDYGRLID
ncbi:hypothetical protein EDD37DRAFT_329510 [Exophiala viscosa]|uniref:uncharacterized protein n=1 Tax=Exophiala viscosa TaxID=2486360 RepID=UPI002198965F|nr:hypothetical protein EDD37DRAFT_329510 [Exophiala viscosa]